jgi:phage terminase Nu1 subunit (DNA packaging protein)
MQCNKKHLAEIFGITERTLTTYQSAGLPFKAGGPGKDNEYDTIAVYNWLVARAKSSNSSDYYTEKARLTKAQADKEELKVLEMRGQLLNADAVSDAWAKQIAAARAKFLSLPTKIAPLVISQPLETAQLLLQNYIEEALHELANERLTEPNPTTSPETLEAAPTAHG